MEGRNQNLYYVTSGEPVDEDMGPGFQYQWGRSQDLACAQ